MLAVASVAWPLMLVLLAPRSRRSMVLVVVLSLCEMFFQISFAVFVSEVVVVLSVAAVLQMSAAVASKARMLE